MTAKTGVKKGFGNKSILPFKRLLRGLAGGSSATGVYVPAEVKIDSRGV
jgi:hypothetical protein